MSLDMITRFVPLIAGLLYAVVGVAYILKKSGRGVRFGVLTLWLILV